MKKRLLTLALVALCTLSLCACQTSTSGKNKGVGDESTPEATATPEPTEAPKTITAEQVNDPYKDVEEPKDNTEKEETEKEATATATPEPTEAPVPTGELASPIINSIKAVMQDSEEARYFYTNRDDMDVWRTALSQMCVSFPSSKEITEGLNVKSVTSEDELIDYINTYSDIWSIKEDSITVEGNLYSYNHSWFYNHYMSNGDGKIYYYIIENPNFDMAYSYEVDEKEVYYDESTKNLYLTLVPNFNYEEYLYVTNATNTIEDIKEGAKSNRMFMVLHYPDEVEINDVIVLMPRVVASNN